MGGERPRPSSILLRGLLFLVLGIGAAAEADAEAAGDIVQFIIQQFDGMGLRGLDLLRDAVKLTNQVTIFHHVSLLVDVSGRNLRPQELTPSADDPLGNKYSGAPLKAGFLPRN